MGREVSTGARSSFHGSLEFASRVFLPSMGGQRSLREPSAGILTSYIRSSDTQPQAPGGRGVGLGAENTCNGRRESCAPGFRRGQSGPILKEMATRMKTATTCYNVVHVLKAAATAATDVQSTTRVLQIMHRTVTALQQRLASQP